MLAINNNGFSIMAHAPHPVSIDPKEQERAEETWSSFATLMKWCVIFSMAILIVLGFIFWPETT